MFDTMRIFPIALGDKDGDVVPLCMAQPGNPGTSQVCRYQEDKDVSDAALCGRTWTRTYKLDSVMRTYAKQLRDADGGAASGGRFSSSTSEGSRPSASPDHGRTLPSVKFSHTTSLAMWLLNNHVL